MTETDKCIYKERWREIDRDREKVRERKAKEGEDIDRQSDRAQRNLTFPTGHIRSH